MFCPKCGSLMFPDKGKLRCGSCGTERSFSTKDQPVTKVARVGKDKPMDTLVLDEITDTLPRTRVECPKCGHYEAFWVMRQTRAADEPTTRIYRCVKCSNTWREY
jgi:DNA-directed RNA polymerase subunit M